MEEIEAVGEGENLDLELEFRPNEAAAAEDRIPYRLYVSRE